MFNNKGSIGKATCYNEKEYNQICRSERNVKRNMKIVALPPY